MFGKCVCEGSQVLGDESKEGLLFLGDSDWQQKCSTFSRESTSYTLMIPRPMVSMMVLMNPQLYITTTVAFTFEPNFTCDIIHRQRHYSPLQNNPIINHPTTIRQSNSHHFSKLMVSSTSHKIDRADYSVICTRYRPTFDRIS